MDKSSATLLDLDIDDGQNDAAAQLQFQEFTSSNVGVAELDISGSAKEHSISFESTSSTNAQPNQDSEDDAKGGPSFWTFNYYQNFFDVNTAQVKHRMIYSMVPSTSKNYLEDVIKPKPDLYGPFWICVTLVFTIAVSRNLASYQQFLQYTSTTPYHWKYEFHTVSYAATAIFSYAWLLPLVVWGIIWWQGGHARLTFLQLLCLYGYSLSIFIPVSILWVIQLPWLQWLLFGISVALSGSVLVMSMWPAALEAGRHLALPLVAVVLGLHTLLAAGLMIFFFHTSEGTNTPVVVTSSWHQHVTNSSTFAPA